MRLWSLHPQYLDAKGLVALWREALLAQAVLAGKTKGYTHHPQLLRFQKSRAPRKYIAAYLKAVHDEAVRRGYRFDAKKIGRSTGIRARSLRVSSGQLEYEWTHLMKKLGKRDPLRRKQLSSTNRLKPHPLFRITAGGVAEWEVL
ncbi:MAG TPA: pyrimidine dimer DNA glycosylase/endonuclease V [Gammaproteobacteria bacterium]|nr:pyrimidine dimer DNA glycosylase/endonuclease V [Gammaproteobacteria bacterium]